VAKQALIEHAVIFDGPDKVVDHRNEKPAPSSKPVSMVCLPSGSAIR
jgi:hypothetical protein